MLLLQLQVQGLNELVGGLGAMPELMAAENAKAMVISTHILEAEIKPLTPRKTGRLQSAWEPSTTGVGFATIGVVEDQVGYAAAVEKGSRPHDIWASSAQALMIPVGGSGFGGGKLSGGARAGQQVAFFQHVRHPGTRGRHMAAEGLQIARPAILREFQIAAERAIQIALRAGISAFKGFTGGR